MRYIAPVAVITVLVLQAAGATPGSSVGGAMILGFVVLVATAAVGMLEAWSKRRGVFGWIVSIVCALVGALLATEMVDLIIGPLLALLNLVGPPATALQPLRYLASAGMMLLALLGSWITLRVVSRWR